MFKALKIFTISITVVGMYSMNIGSLNYYDLYFEKTSDTITRGSYERLHNDVKYEIDYNLDLSKDELDSINHAIKLNLDSYKKISKENINNNVENKNIKVRPVYREIRGNVVKDYKSWNKKKEIIIKIPIDIEFVEQ
jgi:hypothetical protein